MRWDNSNSLALSLLNFEFDSTYSRKITEFNLKYDFINIIISEQAWEKIIIYFHLAYRNGVTNSLHAF